MNASPHTLYSAVVPQALPLKIEEYCPLGFDVVELLQQVPPKQWYIFTKLHSITFMNTVIFILNTMRA